jgi:phosphoribosylformylglycinamidine cyclo-ligase
MGAGFAVFVRRSDVDPVVRIAASQGISATHAGNVEAGEKRVIIEPVHVTFEEKDLRLRA